MKKTMRHILSQVNFLKEKQGNFLLNFGNKQKALGQMPHYWAMVPVKVKTGKDIWKKTQE